jgi:hypothetical protein
MVKPHPTFKPCVILDEHHNVNVEGKIHKGFLGADETSLFVEYKVSAGFGKTMSHRQPVVIWSTVTGYSINGAEQGGGIAAALNHDLQHATTTLVLKTPGTIKSFAFKFGPAKLYNLLGPRLAAVDTRLAETERG